MNYPHVLAALCSGAAGSLFVVIGMASTGWLTNNGGISIGLFVVCAESVCESYLASGPLVSIRAFVSIAFLCSLAGSIVCLVYYIKHFRKNTIHGPLALATGILFMVAAATALLGAIIFASNGFTHSLTSNGYTLGYSFAMTIVGGLFCVAAGVLALIHRFTAQA